MRAMIWQGLALALGAAALTGVADAAWADDRCSWEYYIGKSLGKRAVGAGQSEYFAQMQQAQARGCVEALQRGNSDGFRERSGQPSLSEPESVSGPQLQEALNDARPDKVGDPQPPTWSGQQLDELCRDKRISMTAAGLLDLKKAAGAAYQAFVNARDVSTRAGIPYPDPNVGAAYGRYVEAQRKLQCGRYAATLAR